jgi:4,5-dihydroxyphthalate decarboxylase
VSRLHVSYAGHVSDRVEDLYSGRVQVEGVDLHFIPLSPAEAFRRASNGEFDMSEMSFSTSIMRIARGDDAFVAIPVFPSRTFRHGAVYVRRSAAISRPEDLVGRNVGVPEYQMTAALWVRGMLQHEYGVAPDDLNWITGGLRDPGRKPLIDVEIPGVTITHVEDRSLDSLLVEGEIDAVIAPQAPPSFATGNPDVTRLFPDVRAVEEEYFRTTGLFPIMHVVVLRRSFYEAFPWVAVNMFGAFDAAKRNCMQRLGAAEPLPVSLPWIDEELEAVRSMMGEDFWPYGIDANRAVLETACRYVHEQGLSDRVVGVDELFAPNVVGLKSSTLL